MPELQDAPHGTPRLIEQDRTTKNVAGVAGRVESEFEFSVASRIRCIPVMSGHDPQSSKHPLDADQRIAKAQTMNEQPTVSVPTRFWVIAVIALLWNIMGCVIFLSEVFAKEAMMESFSEEQKEWSRSTPTWIYVVFAISVATGVAGSIWLLMRKKSSVPLFKISLVAVLIQMVYTMLIAGGLQIMGPSGAVMPAFVVLLSIAWLLFSLFSKGKGWLVQ